MPNLPDKSDSVILAEIAEKLGSAATSTQCFRIYFPDKDRNGATIGVEHWINAAKILLADINGGATVARPLQGVWRDYASGNIITETTAQVYSFIQNAPWFLDQFDLIITLIHNFGKSTNQGEVLVELDAYAFRIRDFRFADI